MAKNKFTPVTHVIFDFDGLLVNTEVIYTKATQAVCDPFGKKFTWAEKSQVMGLTPQKASMKIIELLQLPLSLDEFCKQMESEIDKRLHELNLMPGALKLMDHFKAHNIPMAIATGSTSTAFARKTSGFQEVFTVGQYFDHIVFAGDDPEVKNGKPAPDVFMVASNRFRLTPKESMNVLVFEDAPAGVLSAQAAGMQVAMVPDPCLTHSTQPTQILESLAHFEPLHYSLPAFVPN